MGSDPTHQMLIRHENVPQSEETKRNKEKHESANNQTNEQTPTHTFTQTSTLTTRPLESSFELQTQTQTPTAGCSPKATKIRRGAFSTSAGVLGHRVEFQNLTKVSRTDEISS